MARSAIWVSRTQHNSPRFRFASSGLLADCPCMNDLARLDRAHVGRIEGHDRNGIAGKRRKLNLIACTLPMHQHDGANVTGGKPLLGQIMLQNDEVQFVDHGVAILLGTNVTKRGRFSCDSTNHTTRTTGARPSGVGNGPSISYLVPKRVWSDAATSFAFACAFPA